MSRRRSVINFEPSRACRRFIAVTAVDIMYVQRYNIIFAASLSRASFFFIPT